MFAIELKLEVKEMSEWFIKSAFLFTSVIHFLPSIGILGSEKLVELYGVSISDANHLLMMRHRAALFGVVGSVLGISIFRKSWRSISYFIGLSSMSSYLMLSLISLEGGTSGLASTFNAKIQRVFWIDVMGVLWLGSAALASASSRPHLDKSN